MGDKCHMVANVGTSYVGDVDSINAVVGTIDKDNDPKLLAFGFNRAGGTDRRRCSERD